MLASRMVNEFIVRRCTSNTSVARSIGCALIDRAARASVSVRWGGTPLQGRHRAGARAESRHRRPGWRRGSSRTAAPIQLARRRQAHRVAPGVVPFIFAQVCDARTAINEDRGRLLEASSASDDIVARMLRNLDSARDARVAAEDLLWPLRKSADGAPGVVRRSGLGVTFGDHCTEPASYRFGGFIGLKGRIIRPRSAATHCRRRRWC